MPSEREILPNGISPRLVAGTNRAAVSKIGFGASGARSEDSSRISNEGAGIASSDMKLNSCVKGAAAHAAQRPARKAVRQTAVFNFGVPQV